MTQILFASYLCNLRHLRLKIICRHLFHLPFFKLNKDYDYYMKGTFPIHKFRELRTPFYYYDTKVLRDTLSCIRTEAARYGNYSVHYAVKANANPRCLPLSARTAWVPTV